MEKIDPTMEKFNVATLVPEQVRSLEEDIAKAALLQSGTVLENPSLVFKDAMVHEIPSPMKVTKPVSSVNTADKTFKIHDAFYRHRKTKPRSVFTFNVDTCKDDDSSNLTGFDLCCLCMKGSFWEKLERPCKCIPQMIHASCLWNHIQSGETLKCRICDEIYKMPKSAKSRVERYLEWRNNTQAGTVLCVGFIIWALCVAAIYATIIVNKNNIGSKIIPQ